MANIFKTLLRITAALLGILMLAVIVFWFVGPDACNNEILAKIPSPDKKYNLYIFQRDCGATTGFSTQASILPVSESLPNKKGNIFIADTNHGEAPSGKGGGPELKADWQQSGFLSLKYHKKTRVFESEASYDEVKITYATFN